MSDNPLQPVFTAIEGISNCIRTQLTHFTGRAIHPTPTNENPPFSLSSSNPSSINSSSSILSQAHDINLTKGKSAQPATKEELGRATWTFLHTLAAQYPERPTRQQKKDVKELMAILSRMYPCKDCADHFKQVLRANPVQAGSQAEFSQWLCHVHNVVNRRTISKGGARHGGDWRRETTLPLSTNIPASGRTHTTSQAGITNPPPPPDCNPLPISTSSPPLMAPPRQVLMGDIISPATYQEISLWGITFLFILGARKKWKSSFPSVNSIPFFLALLRCNSYQSAIILQSQSNQVVDILIKLLNSRKSEMLTGR